MYNCILLLRCPNWDPVFAAAQHHWESPGLRWAAGMALEWPVLDVFLICSYSKKLGVFLFCRGFCHVKIPCIIPCIVWKNACHEGKLWSLITHVLCCRPNWLKFGPEALSHGYPSFHCHPIYPFVFLVEFAGFYQLRSMSVSECWMTSLAASADADA